MPLPLFIPIFPKSLSSSSSSFISSLLNTCRVFMCMKQRYTTQPLQFLWFLVSHLFHISPVTPVPNLLLHYTAEEQQDSQCVSAVTQHVGNWRAPDVFSWMILLLFYFFCLSPDVILMSHHRLSIYTYISTLSLYQPKYIMLLVPIVSLCNCFIAQMREGTLELKITCVIWKR